MASRPFVKRRFSNGFCIGITRIQPNSEYHSVTVFCLLYGDGIKFECNIRIDNNDPAIIRTSSLNKRQSFILKRKTAQRILNDEGTKVECWGGPKCAVTQYRIHLCDKLIGTIDFCRTDLSDIFPEQ